MHMALPQTWYYNLLKSVAPKLYIRLFAKSMGAVGTSHESLDKILRQFARADIFPLKAARGFMIVLDQKLSLHFYQDGDHFVYDGFEMGTYRAGSVTVLDALPETEGPYITE